jgi:hypothetical protein
MKPIYFPFTYVPHGVAQALAACFQRFIVYQPSGKKVPDEMLPWVDANRMEVRVPDQTDDQAIEEVVKDFRSFASLHNDSGNLKTAAFLGQHSATPFFSETSTSRIVSDLKKGVSTDSPERGSDPLFCARVFLGFAQDFDRQGAELNRGLGVHAQQSCALLNDPVGSGLFVTSSKSVFNQLTAKLPAFEKILQSAGLPAAEIKDKAFNAWRDSFLKHLTRLGETDGSASQNIGVDLPLNSGGGTNVMLTLYLVPGKMPWDFFAQYLEARQPPKKHANQKTKFKNTLVGLVECQS